MNNCTIVLLNKIKILDGGVDFTCILELLNFSLLNAVGGCERSKYHDNMIEQKIRVLYCHNCFLHKHPV